MAASSVTARRYFSALAARDLDTAANCWAPGGVGRVSGGAEVDAARWVPAHFATLYEAFPDFQLEVLDTTTQRERCVVRWRAIGTFVGPGRYQGLIPTGARAQVEGCDVLVVENDRIVRDDAYLDTRALARALGLLPATRSFGGAGLLLAANIRTRTRHALHGAEPEAIAPGVWVLRGGRPRRTNVYLLQDEDGLTLFDAGSSGMHDAIIAAGIHLGGIARIVLGNADCDHRGGAARLDVPVQCHPLERSAAESPSPFRDYWDFGKLPTLARAMAPRLALAYDGGALGISGTVQEGDQVAGFRVVDLPGHAPGQIGLFREEDRLALASDSVLTVNATSGRKVPAHVPPPAFNYDTEQARESIRKLAGLAPAVVWTGHADPVAGDDVELQLQRAAVSPV